MSVRLTRAEQQQRTRDRVIEAAERLFVGAGVPRDVGRSGRREAGYTKGAVYSNFASKEDLFFAVYERRAERGVAEIRHELAAAGDGGQGLAELALAAARRRGRDDGWLAVFFEFWAHVVRRPGLRARFADIHLRVQVPIVEALVSHAREHGYVLPEDPRKLTVALYAMQLGLSLERLTLPSSWTSGSGCAWVACSSTTPRKRRRAEGDADEPRLPAQAAG